MRDWLGRTHVETLRSWPELSQAVARIESQPEVFLGALLLGSLSRGEGDSLSDVDLVAVAHRGHWEEAWQARRLISSGALVTFDRLEEGKTEVAGHSWLAPSLVKTECLIAAPGRMRLHGSAIVLVGDDDLVEAFDKAAPLTREQVDDYAANLRETNAISEIERTYGDLIALLRREVRADDRAHPPRLPT